MRGTQEAESEDLLTAFHLERLRAYASDKETWHAVDAIAFETIPLAREVKAIRRAVAALEDELAPEERKPWWVCTIYPGGEIPEEHPGVVEGDWEPKTCSRHISMTFPLQPPLGPTKAKARVMQCPTRSVSIAPQRRTLRVLSLPRATRLPK
jgi:hypothetical protein